ncbi:Protoporphyrinogen oxidase [Roseateles sp. YR242]|uniref:flavin monoamine oxidase family protein n=1 Tax=Roseateles sp. YR242 TaxID=1855305 RepID=UPI0008ACDF35|nr:FAD-dependent oxidoreductase [Roseateles sp. YR242]SEK21701.1 Protoporphyrinogen oxidase [Roseateles sp. YR242]
MGQAALSAKPSPALPLAATLSQAATPGLRRRELLALGLLPMLAACGREAGDLAERLATKVSDLPGGWVGASVASGHRLREAPPAWDSVSDSPRRAQVLVLGAGIAGLSCARRLRARGVEVALLDLEPRPGGNSRGHLMGGLPCPLGAHYLPVPGPEAPEVQALLEELGLARLEAGRWQYDERHLCHSPQERLWFQDQWVDGLLPPAESPEVLAQYRRFAALVEAARRDIGFAMPSTHHRWTAGHDVLDRQTFAAWLDTHGLNAPPLRWYLDYCCRDDYGAPAAEVSAWAGLHYFGSRHGFMSLEEREAVLTWPQGNGWLSERLAAPLAESFHAGQTVLRVREERHGVQVLSWDHQADRPQRWAAEQVVLALPLFIAGRVVEQPSSALAAMTPRLCYAPWLVANLRLDDPPLERLGAPLSWDNVVYGSDNLGYVNANHQSLDPRPGPCVLTAYRALPQPERRALLTDDWRGWAAKVLADLAPLHPDLLERLQAVDLMRYGHAMSIPVPGLRGAPALAALRESGQGRIHHAHADLAGYSVLEEAFTQGEKVAQRLLGAKRP